MAGTVTGVPNVLLRLENLGFGLIAVAAYSYLETGWLLFACLFLVPDLSILGYLAGPRVGAIIYNLMHWYGLPVVGIVIGAEMHMTFVTALSLIWVAHIGLDRALGFGLKYPDGFRFTHLGAAEPSSSGQSA